MKFGVSIWPMKYLILITLFASLAHAQDFYVPGYSFEDDYYHYDEQIEQTEDYSNHESLFEDSTTRHLTMQEIYSKPQALLPDQKQKTKVLDQAIYTRPEMAQLPAQQQQEYQSPTNYAIPVGFYTNGSIRNAQVMPHEGEGFVRLYIFEDRGWGADSTIRTIVDAAAYMSRKFPGRDRLQVEDISAQHGGKISGHGSHQNGLDADLQYFKRNNMEHSPEMTGSKYAPSMVEGNSVIENFDTQRNWELVKALHIYGRVQRIFMDQVIKNHLCSYAKEIGEYKNNIKALASIRHVTNHKDHLHVRMRCPKGAKECRAQGDVGASSGCP